MASRLVVEWTRTSVRIALAKGRGQHSRLVRVMGEVLTPSSSPSETLRRLIKTMKVTAPEIIDVIPREQVITRVVKFPTMRSVELNQMVELYAKGQLPYPREQTVLDFHLLRQQEGFSTVAIVACQNEVIEKHLSVLREAGQSARFITVSASGVLGWYQHLRLHAQAAKEKPSSMVEEPSLVINVDETRTDLALIADKRILSSRSVGQGEQDWKVLSDVGALLATEAERSRAAVRKELPGMDVRSLIVTGVGALTSWAQGLSQHMGLPAVAIEVASSLGTKAVPASIPGSPVVIGGIAVSDPRELLNLSPAEVHMQTRHRRQVRELVTVGVLLIGVMAFGGGLLAQHTSRQDELSTRVDRALARIEPTAKQVQEKARVAKLVTSILKERQQLAMVLSSIFRKTPRAIALEAMTYERAKNDVILRGNAASTQDVLQYIEELKKVEAVADVSLKYSSRRKTLTGERARFELVLRQEPGRLILGD